MLGKMYANWLMDWDNAALCTVRLGNKALDNEFFSKACNDWRKRLANGLSVTSSSVWWLALCKCSLHCAARLHVCLWVNASSALSQYTSCWSRSICWKSHSTVLTCHVVWIFITIEQVNIKSEQTQAADSAGRLAALHCCHLSNGASYWW